MPRLSRAPASKHIIEFVVSEPLDLMNAMYFSHLAGEIEGIDGWPERVRGEMEPQLLRELDFLYSFPLGQPGVMGTMGDRLFGYPETWRGVDSLLRFVRELPEGVGKWPDRLGVQGLVLYSIGTPTALGQRDVDSEANARETLRRLVEAEGRDVAPVLEVYERPAELRERMARLIERFYDEHYRQDLPRRLPCMERSVAAYREVREADVAAFMRRLTGRPGACCEEDIQRGAFDRFIFVPSLDMGPYMSCGVIGRTHGLYYACEAQSADEGAQEEERRRVARLYKALSDEQRLRILGMLREREMYAQEIVERTGLHQSVVSRHLTFMKAVGLLGERRQNNMKFYTISPSIGEELSKTLDLFAPRAGGEDRGV
jgi:DNA-binding transcriptional ArsR family regulator